jgi:hypothetical protein
VIAVLSRTSTSIDGRYDAFVELEPDGISTARARRAHAIERILPRSARAAVVAFESALPNYREARHPADAAGRNAFATRSRRLIDDVDIMRADFELLALDPPLHSGRIDRWLNSERR